MIRPRTVEELGEAGSVEVQRTVLGFIRQGARCIPGTPEYEEAEKGLADLIETLDDEEAANVVAALAGFGGSLLRATTRGCRRHSDLEHLDEHLDAVLAALDSS